MKNQFKGFVSGILVTLLLVGCIGTAAATVGSKTAQLQYNDIHVTLDGTQVNLADANGNPAEPFIIDGTTYLPVRAISGALGLEVSWDAATHTVILTHPGAAQPSQPSQPQSGSSSGTPSSMTTGQKNALESAKRYLQVSAFSRSGLIKQLEYEKYSTEDATFAADNCCADWYEQAAKSAKRYLDIMSFSKASLISQLEYEGFTHDQAVYGAEQNGY